MNRVTYINDLGEVVWADTLKDNALIKMKAGGFHDWYHGMLISQPVSVEMVKDIKALAQHLKVEVRPNVRLMLSLAEPEQLVNHFRAQMFAMSSAEACHFPIYGIRTEPRVYPTDFVRAGARYAMHAHKCFIADPNRADRMNVAAIAARQVKGFPTLLVCRRQDAPDWLAVFEHWFRDSFPRFTLEDMPDPLPKECVLVVEYGQLPWQVDKLVGQKFWCTIVDHSEMIKNPEAQRTANITRLARFSHYVFLVSDFPMNLQVSDLLEPLELIGKKREFTGLTAFMKEALPDPLEQYPAYRKTDEEQRRLKRLHVTLRSTCLLRRGVDFGLQYQERVAYIAESADIPAEFKDDEVKSPLHRLGLCKVQDALRWIEECCKIHAEKFVIVTHHQRVGDYLAQQLNVPHLYGGVASEVRRDEIVARFLDPAGPQMLVIAKDLYMTPAWDFRSVRLIVFVEPPFAPDDLKNILDKFQDDTNPVPLVGQYLFTNHPIDLDAMDRLDLRLERMQVVLDVEEDTTPPSA